MHSSTNTHGPRYYTWHWRVYSDVEEPRGWVNSDVETPVQRHRGSLQPLSTLLTFHVLPSVFTDVLRWSVFINLTSFVAITIIHLKCSAGAYTHTHRKALRPHLGSDFLRFVWDFMKLHVSRQRKHRERKMRICVHVVTIRKCWPWHAQHETTLTPSQPWLKFTADFHIIYLHLRHQTTAAPVGAGQGGLGHLWIRVNI